MNFAIQTAVAFDVEGSCFLRIAFPGERCLEMVLKNTENGPFDWEGLINLRGTISSKPYLSCQDFGCESGARSGGEKWGIDHPVMAIDSWV